MQRTKKGRNVPPFLLKSGAATPYPFLKGLKNVGKKIMEATPIGMAVNALKGGGNSEGDNSIGARLDRIEAAVTSGSGEEGIVDPQEELLNEQV
jgi:hypothetical protein